MSRAEADAAEFLASALLKPRHGFFTREGGMSTGPYASLNGSLSGGDDRVHVIENRRRVAASIGIDYPNLRGLTQMHGAEVIHVTGPWRIGEPFQADAMVTDRPGMGLVIVTADCAPVLLADSAEQIIGAAHAGWRGALAGVLEATAEAMRGLGAKRLTAIIGPCIAQASYQVGEDMHQAIMDHNHIDARFMRDDGPGHWRFDLAGYCAARLRSNGVRAETLDLDTYTDEQRFFSHRRRTHGGGGPIGHQMSAIGL